MLYLVLINGLIDSFNPCAIGVLISYLAVLLSLKVKRRSFIAFGLFYILATYATYLLIGLGILKVMHLFGIHNFFGWAAAILVLLIGLSNLKDFIWPRWQIPYLTAFLNRCRLPKWKVELTIVSALILGVLVGICEFPCSGGIYLATVGLLSAQATFWQGVLYLLIYNLMFVMPLMVLFIFASWQRMFKFLQKLHQSTFTWLKLLMALAMIASGILLIIWLIN